ncbi:MAG: DUF2207 domain-containing protein [Actinomycetaceae bacterium]|nr:DUF2207 domain-containing protein [Actinomycetaceae bacterium]
MNDTTQAFNSKLPINRSTQRKYYMRAISVFMLAALFIFCFPPASSHAADAFTIERYHIDIKVRNDNSYQITEHITADFSEQRHGIVRIIPDRTNQAYTVDIRNIKANTTLSAEKTTEGLEIRLGDEDTLVEGTVSYKLSYIYDIGEDNLPDMDEFYFNLIGTEWDTTINNVSFDITMPSPFSAEKLNFTYGKEHSKKQPPLELSLTDTRISGTLTTQLHAYEGLTIALPLPQGYFDGELRSGYHRWLIIEPIVYFVFALIVLVVWLIVKLLNRHPSTVEFSAPEDINPADMAYIYTGEVSDRAVSALFLHWISLGYFRLDEVPASQTTDGKNSTWVFTLLPKQQRFSKSYERSLIDSVIRKRNKNEQIPLEKLGLVVSSIKKSVAEHWDSKLRDVTTQTGQRLATFLSILEIGVCIWASWWTTYHIFELWTAVIVGVIFGFVLWGFVVLGLSHSLVTHLSKARQKENDLLIMLGLSALILAILFYSVWNYSPPQRIWYIIFAVIAAMLSSSFSQNIRVYSDYGKKRLTQLDGFVNFMKTTQRDTIQGFNPNTFTENMPFAYALNLQKQWIKTFSALIDKHLDPIMAQQWKDYAIYYDNLHEDRFRYLEKEVYDSYRYAGSSRSSSGSSYSSSSSSSSGGYSGGGSGGGGGRSW